MSGKRLNSEEDAALRRMHWFEGLGCELASALRMLKDGFRSRDRRAAIRDPFHTINRDGGEQQASGPDVDGYWIRLKQ